MAGFWYDNIKKYYDKGIYSKEDVREFVVLGKITQTEYEQITGEPYTTA